MEEKDSKLQARGVRERLLDDNPIVDIWRIAHVANYYVFPMFREFDRSLGLNRAQFVSLLCLCHGGAETAQEIVVGSGLPKNSISRAVRLLESKKLIRRKPSETDGRAIQLTPTKAGESQLALCIDYAQRRQSRALSALSASEKARLDALILKLCHSVPDWAEMETIES